MNIDMDAVLALADPGDTKRSREIFSSSIYLMSETDDQLVAQVVGGEIYTVTLTSTLASGPHADCTCPVPREWCKHAITVARAAAEHAWNDSIPVPTLSRLAMASNAELAEIIDELRRRVPQVGPVLATLEFGRPDLDEEVALAIASAREASRGICTEDGAARAAERWEYALHVADSASAGFYPVELIIGKLLLLSDVWPLPHPAINHAVREGLTIHARMAQHTELDFDDFAVFAVDVYRHGFRLDLGAYTHVIGGRWGELSAYFDRGYGVLHPTPEHSALDFDLAVASGDLEEAESLGRQAPLQDDLLRNRVAISPPLLRETAERFFGLAGATRFNRMLFQANQTPDTFDIFLQSPGLTYGYALEVAMNSDDYPPSYMLMAATYFDRYEEGMWVLDKFDVNEALQAEFAEAVVVKHDPATAARMLMNHVSTIIEIMLEQAAMGPFLESPQLLKGLKEAAERVREIGAIVDETHAGYAAWVAELDALKERYAAFPPVAEALESVGL